ncbi:hypothetical protein HOC80_02025 [archaeon]|jgi:hypothetical protein|nr:hypothetical protein [archaeon]MBT4416859.1 hypothetical protein [archaeon]
MVKEDFVDLKARAKKEEETKRKDKEFWDHYHAIKNSFLLELSAKTSKEYVFGEGGDIFEKTSFHKPNKKVGNIYISSGKRYINEIKLNLYDESIEKEFSSQIKKFEKNLQQDPIIRYGNKIEYLKLTPKVVEERAKEKTREEDKIKSFWAQFRSIESNFLARLSTKTGKKYKLGEHGSIVEKKSWFRSKEIGSIYMDISYESAMIYKIEIALFDQSIEKEFGLQVVEFEKELKEDPTINFRHHIAYRKVW